MNSKDMKENMKSQCIVACAVLFTVVLALFLMQKCNAGISSRTKV